MLPPFPHLQLLLSPLHSLLPQCWAAGWLRAEAEEGLRHCCSWSFPLLLLLHISPPPTHSLGETGEGSSPLAGVWGELRGRGKGAFSPTVQSSPYSHQSRCHVVTAAAGSSNWQEIPAQTQSDCPRDGHFPEKQYSISIEHYLCLIYFGFCAPPEAL